MMMTKRRAGRAQGHQSEDEGDQRGHEAGDGHPPPDRDVGVAGRQDADGVAAEAEERPLAK